MKTVMRNIFLKQMQRFRKIYKDLSYLLERKKLEKVKKLVCGIEDREKYVVHKIPLKQALNHGLKRKWVHRVIQLRSMHESMYWTEH